MIEFTIMTLSDIRGLEPYYTVKVYLMNYGILS